MTPDTPSSDRRRKFIGRAVVIGLLLLVAAYVVPMFLSLGR